MHLYLISLCILGLLSSVEAVRQPTCAQAATGDSSTSYTIPSGQGIRLQYTGQSVTQYLQLEWTVTSPGAVTDGTPAVGGGQNIQVWLENTAQCQIPNSVSESETCDYNTGSSYTNYKAALVVYCINPTTGNSVCNVNIFQYVFAYSGSNSNGGAGNAVVLTPVFSNISQSISSHLADCNTSIGLSTTATIVIIIFVILFVLLSAFSTWRRIARTRRYKATNQPLPPQIISTQPYSPQYAQPQYVQPAYPMQDMNQPLPPPPAYFAGTDYPTNSFTPSAPNYQTQERTIIKGQQDPQQQPSQYHTPPPMFSDQLPGAAPRQ